MPDIFDSVDAKQGDVFDQIGDIFDDVEVRENKRKSLQQEMLKTRIERQGGEATEFLAGAATGIAKAVVQAGSIVDPTGVVANMGARQGVEHPAPIIKPEDIDTAVGFVQEGLQNFGVPVTAPPEGVAKGVAEGTKELASGMTSAPMVGMLGIGKFAPAEVAKIFQLQMLGQVPQATTTLQEAQTPEEMGKALVGLTAAVTGPVAIGSHLEKPITIPDFTGKQVTLPRGAKPEQQAVAIERATAEQAKATADMLNREADTAMDISVVAPKTAEAVKDVVPDAVKPEPPKPPVEKPATVINDSSTNPDTQFKISTGDVLVSESGRTLTPAPKIDATSNQKAGNTIKRVQSWLIENAIEEAKSKGDEFNGLTFSNMKAGKLSPADMDMLNDYLFGSELGATAKHVKKGSTDVQEKGQGQEVLNAPPAEVTKAGEITQGPGARTGTATKEAPESYEGTAIKNAVAEVERVAYGLPEVAPTERQGIGEAWIKAKGVMEQDSGAGERVVQQLAENPNKGLSDVDSAVLLRHKVDIENKMNSIAEQQSRSTDPAERTSLQAQYEFYSDKLLGLLNAAHARGGAWGREGRWRQIIAKEDMSLATLESRRRQTLGGRELTEVERAETKAIADRYADLQKKLAAAEERVKLLEVQKAIDEAAGKPAKPEGISDYAFKIAEQIASRLDKRADAARERLKARMGRMSSGVDPTVIADLAEIGAAHIWRGGLEFAKWSDRMVKDVGDWAMPYLKEAFEASKKLIDTEVVSRAGKARAQEVKKAAKVTDDVVGKISDAISRKTVDGDKKPNISYQVARLVRELVKQGVKTPGEVADKVYAIVDKALPGVFTRTDVVDIISGYGNYKTISKDAVSVAVRDVKGQLQQIRKLEDMAEGKAPKKTGFERRTPSDEERHYIKQVEAKKKEGGYTVTDPETQLRTALQAAKTRVENQIKDLEHQIAKKQKIVKEKRELKPDAELEALRARRDELREIFDEVFKKPEMTEAERLALWKKKALEKIEEYKDRIARGDFKTKPKPDPVRLDKEALQIRYEMHTVHKALLDMRLKDQLSQRGKVRRAWDAGTNIVRFVRAMMTGGEFSAVLRQGGFHTMAHPIRTAKTLPDMFRALMSEKHQFRINEEIQMRENAPLYQQSGLEFTEAGVRLSTMEEMYMFRTAEWLKKTPGAKHLVGSLEAFQRAYTTFLNKIRADSFDAIVKAYGRDLDTAKVIANFINVSTGRGSRGIARWVGNPGMNAIFFAPRYSISRLQLLAMQPIAVGKTWKHKRMIMGEYIRALAGLGTVYALGSMAGGEIETDRTSSDFGKIKLGDTRLDPLFGLAQWIRLISTEWRGTRKTAKGKTVPIRGKVPFGQPNGKDIALQFAVNKMSPQVSAGLGWLGGEDAVGQPMTWQKQLQTSLIPITYGDIYKMLEEQDDPTKEAALFALAMLGMGMQTYDPYDKSK